MTSQKHISALELDKVLELLAGRATCSVSAERLRKLTPLTSYNAVTESIKKTADIHALSTKHGTPGLGGIADTTDMLHLAARGGRLSIGDLLAVTRLLKTIRTVKSWHKTAATETAVDDLFEILYPAKNLEDILDKAIISETELADTASPELASIRKRIIRAQSSVREHLDKIIRSTGYSKILQEAIVTIRDGRFVVPVRTENKGEINGLVHGTSASGATVFIEPMAVVEENNRLRMLESEEQQEIDRILLELSGMVGEISVMLIESFDALVELDMVFAKSRLADTMRAAVPVVNNDGIIRLRKARHPLIDKDAVVPVDITLGETFDTLVITGPNTGGKTVSLKTLGLLTLMAACGLMLPVGDGSTVPVFENVLADIGDEQSIEQSLSTFSAHIKNLISILEHANERSLVLVDELGSGTDPIEGAALAVSIIETLRSQGAVIAATTHYAEIKMFALTTDGVENGSCEFDVETLSPTYRLLIGVPGRSNAFAISKRLGLRDTVIERAKDLVSTENLRFEDVIDRLEETRQQLELEQTAAMSNRQQAQYLKEQIENEKKRLQRVMDEELAKAREQAKTLVERTKSQTDLLLNELEALKKDKDKQEFSQRVGKTASGYKKRIEKLRDEADPVMPTKREDYKLPRKLKSGDTVMITDIGTEGVIISGPDNGGRYMVQAGIMKTKVSEKSLRLVENNTKKTTFNSHRVVREKSSSKASAKATTELDIRGMTADEGIVELDRFIDRSVMMGLGTVTIIHGKGTGVLRTAVQARLKKHRNVRSQRPGVYGEGEAGVTVVELK